VKYDKKGAVTKLFDKLKWMTRMKTKVFLGHEWFRFRRRGLSMKWRNRNGCN